MIHHKSASPAFAVLLLLTLLFMSSCGDTYYKDGISVTPIRPGYTAPDADRPSSSTDEEAPSLADTENTRDTLPPPVSDADTSEDTPAPAPKEDAKPPEEDPFLAYARDVAEDPAFSEFLARYGADPAAADAVIAAYLALCATHDTAVAATEESPVPSDGPAAASVEPTVPGSNPLSTPESTETDIQSREATVYWTDSGAVWHTKSGCSSLSKSKAVHEGTIEEAQEAGKERLCKRCG